MVAALLACENGASGIGLPTSSYEVLRLDIHPNQVICSSSAGIVRKSQHATSAVSPEIFET